MQELGWQVTSNKGVVAGGGAEAVAAGQAMLKAGGNAFDAGVATVFALQVTDHGECSIGGEVPILVYEAATGEVHAISGMGSAPLDPQAIDWYLTNGIPGEGDMRIAPVPSVVDACCTVLARWGTLSFAQVIAPTLALLDRAEADWHPRLAHTLRRMAAAEETCPGSRAEKITAAADLFYGRGADKTIAEEQESFWIAKGGFLRQADLAAHHTRVEKPVMVEYHGYQVYKCGTWTQGPVLCQALRLLDPYPLRDWGLDSAQTIHTVTEAMKLAFADRDAWYGDPEFVQVPLETLFSEPYNAMRRDLIDPQRASQTQQPGDPWNMRPLADAGEPQPVVGGTTTCVTADSQGNLMAATPSANVKKGAHLTGPAGVTFGNRLRSFNTQRGHPNCIAPGKRPRITLTPTLVLKDGNPAFAISVAGGDLQDQVTLQLILDVIDFGKTPSEAVNLPRYATGHMQDSFDPNPDRQAVFMGPGTLVLNGGLPDAVEADLRERMHAITISPGRIGTPVMLSWDRNTGEMAAAGDPLTGRHAAGL